MSYSGPVHADPPAGESSIWLFGYVPGLALNIIGCITMLMVAGPHAYALFFKRGVRSVGLLFAFASVRPCPLLALGEVVAR
jgi:hypothetical protein